ncbi:phosphoribosylglycinamide formyltransferase [Aureimonas sp. Leaf454]|uniref:phosphoribosylglycinamide formyltransferase n=1 Tax=Aureimonas sp. Leaf454 TaxID=1736381 RepID=UPI0006FBC798|nr:phosphoribosylglycinamide formyltransferase [Aureimonas sp. Leaf454]KQT50786.1 phosphoribosylglycinamide formyltransferase [Aureimonas sp. Leaf454]
MTVPKKRVVVLLSGRGSNMGALVEAAKSPDYPAEIVAVISDKANAGGLGLAHEHGIPAIAVPRQGHADKAAHEAAVIAAIEAAEPDLVCLAGYMRLLSADFCERFAGRMINIHPSLLPLFPGLDTHARALAAGVRLHGASVHFVTFEMDGGPIIAQGAVPVSADDTPDSLAARVLKAEHHLYPHALRLVLDGKARFEEGRTVFAGIEPADDAVRLIAPAIA